MDLKQKLSKKTADIKNGIFYSVSYFTSIPIKLNKFDANKSFYQGVMIGLPVVGSILASLIVLVFLILPFHVLYSAVVSAILYLFLTGFLHFEAVCDTIDGWYASYSNKDIYKIMHEPHVGSIGAVATVAIMILEVSALIYCLYEGMFFVIFLSLVLSRVSVYFALNFEFHEKSVFLISLKHSIIKYKIISLLLLPIRLFVDVILNILKNRLGFLNGDTIGFLIVVLEIVILNFGLLFVQL